MKSETLFFTTLAALSLAILVTILTLVSFAKADEGTFVIDQDTIQLVGPVDDFMALSFEKKMKEFQNKLISPAEVFVRIDSPGGFVLAGRKIIRTIKMSSIPVTCLVDSMAASMAAMIFESCHKRLMAEDSILMFHEAAGSFGGPFNLVKSRSAFIFNYVLDIEKSVAKRVGLAFDEYRTKATNEWWMSGEAAKLQKAADMLVLDIKYKNAEKKELPISVWKAIPKQPMRPGLDEIVDIYWGI